MDILDEKADWCLRNSKNIYLDVVWLLNRETHISVKPKSSLNKAVLFTSMSFDFSFFSFFFIFFFLGVP